MSTWFLFAKIWKVYTLVLNTTFRLTKIPRQLPKASGIITRFGCTRFAEFAFNWAIQNNRKKVTIIHKANILKKLTGLFLETATELGKKYAGQIEVEDRIVDNTAMQLVLNPNQFDVLITTNMFG